MVRQHQTTEERHCNHQHRRDEARDQERQQITWWNTYQRQRRHHANHTAGEGEQVFVDPQVTLGSNRHRTRTNDASENPRSRHVQVGKRQTTQHRQWGGDDPTVHVGHSSRMLAFLIAASAFAGWIDAVIGGGGLVLIPILMATTGMPAASVLATNKVAAISGTASAAVSLVRRVGVPKFTWIYALIAGITAALGATAVSLIDDSIANPIIITLLIAVGIFVVVKPTFGTTGERRVSSIRIALGIAAAALIGAYDGIFGPGTGMFLIMAFTAIFTQQFLQSAAMAKVVNTATNLGALIVFGLGGYIDWKLALILAVANVIGAQIGTRTVLKGGSKLVRVALLILVVVLCVKLLKDQGAIG